MSDDCRLYGGDAQSRLVMGDDHSDAMGGDHSDVLSHDVMGGEWYGGQTGIITLVGRPRPAGSKPGRRKSNTIISRHSDLRRRVNSSSWGETMIKSIFILAIVCLILPVASSNNCDVIASGLDRAGREIGAAYVRCSKGTVVWRYPRNGLRVVMKSPAYGREFRGCIRAESSFAGARVMVEGDGTLVPLLNPLLDQLPLQKPRCFSSYNGQAALFLESAAEGFNGNVVSFQYDIELLPKGAYYNAAQECRPCTDDELLRAYCSADLVASGRLLSVDYSSQMEISGYLPHTNNYLTPSPTDATTVGPMLSLPPSGEAHLKFLAGKLIKIPPVEGMIEKMRGGGKVLMVEVPLQCGMRAGPGDYLLMSRLKFGKPVLKCIPKFEQFKSLARNRTEDISCNIDWL